MNCRVSFVLAFALLISSGATANADVLVNPGFELPPITTGVEYYGGGNGWTSFGSGVFTVNSVVTAPHSGNQSLKIFGNFSSGVFQQFAANPGETWNGGVWMKNDSGDLMTATKIAAVNIEWIKANGSNSDILPFISNGTFTHNSPVDVWTLQTITGVAPADAAFARLVLIVGGNGGGAPKYDDAFFELLPVPEPTGLAVLGLCSLGLLGRRRR